MYIHLYIYTCLSRARPSPDIRRGASPPDVSRPSRDTPHSNSVGVQLRRKFNPVGVQLSRSSTPSEIKRRCSAPRAHSGRGLVRSMRPAKRVRVTKFQEISP